MSILLLLLGCTGKAPPDSKPEDTGYAYRDTALVVDTSDSAIDTDTDTDSGESGDTDTGGTTDDTGTALPDWLDLRVWPNDIAVHVGATFPLRVVGTDPDGTRDDLPDDRGTPAYTSDDPSVADVDAAGTVTALAEGTTTIRVDIGGLEADCEVEVRADGFATITVLDGLTGLPIESARVALPFTDAVRTDASGVALLPVTDPGALSFSAWLDDTYDALTVVGVVGRELTVSILPKDTELRSASLHGDVDFSSVDDAGWSDVVVGFAAASLQGSLASMRLEDLFADERSISVFGVDAEAPANLFVEGSADTYDATALPGAAAVWGLGGPIAIADATAGLSGTGDALALLADNLSVMSWGQNVGLVTTADTQTAADLAPADRFDGITTVSVPPLPAGFVGDEDYFLLVSEERADEGYVVTGLGPAGPAGSASIATVPLGTVADSLGTTVLAYGQVGGVGSGGPVSAGIATVNSEGNLIVPLLQDIATIDTFVATARSFGFTVDTDADFVRVRFRDSRNRVHDLLAPGSWSGTIPNCVVNFGLASSGIEILAVQTTDENFEYWLAAGALDPNTKPSITAVRTTQE